MSDNIELNLNETNNDNNIISNNSVNTPNVNMTNKKSSNSLSVPENTIGKASSINSEISLKSSKSNKSLKGEKSKKNKVKKMIKKFEKHIIPGKKKKSESNIQKLIETNNNNQIDIFEEAVQDKNDEKITETENVNNIVEEIEDIKENIIENNKEDNQNVKEEIEEEINKVEVVEEKEESTENKSENEIVEVTFENIVEKEENNEDKIENIIEEKEETTENEAENIKVVEEKEETTENEAENIEVVKEKEETAEDNIENIEVVEEKEETAEDNIENIEVVEEKEETTENEAENIEVVEEKEEIAEDNIENVIEEKEEIAEDNIENIIEEKEETTEDKVENVEVVEEKKETTENEAENIEVVEETEEIPEDKVENIIAEENIENVIEEKEEIAKDKVENVIEEKEEIAEGNVENVIEEKEEIAEDKIENVIEEKEIIEGDEGKEEIIPEKIEEAIESSNEESIEEKQEIINNENIDENNEGIEKKESDNEIEEVIVKESDSEIEEVISIPEQNMNGKESESENEVSEYSGHTNVIDLYKEIGGDSSESEVKVYSSDESYVANELNGFSNALKSINNINNAEKQFLIPNSDAIEDMINKSLKQNSKIEARNSLDVNSLDENRNSYQSHHSNFSHQSQQSGSNLHIQVAPPQIAPPQPPPAAPLPPTPKGQLPSYYEKENHLQHLSLGRLTEINRNEGEKRGSNLSAHSYTIDNSTPLSSTVQMVTIQDVDESNQANTKNVSDDSQPLQAVVYSFDSEEEEEVSIEDYSYNDQPLKAEIHSIEDTEELSETVISADVERELESDIHTEIIEEEDHPQNADMFKNSSKKFKDTLTNIESLLEDLDCQIQSLRTPKIKPVDQEGYDADGEKSLSMAISRSNIIRNSLNIDNEIPNISPNFGSKDSNSSDDRQSYGDSMSEESEPPAIIDGPLSMTTFEDGSMSFPTVTEDGPMSQKSLQEIAFQNALQQSSNSLPLDDEFDLNHSLNNNLKILKNSARPTSARDIPMMKKKKNPSPSPLISSKALKLVGVEKHSIPNMSAKALKMLGMNAPTEKNDFENFEFDERELAMLDAAPTTSPHLVNKSNSLRNDFLRNTYKDEYLSKSLNDNYMPKSLNDDYMSKSLNDEYMPRSLNDEYMSNDDDEEEFMAYPPSDLNNEMMVNERPLSFEALEEAEHLLIDTDVDDSIKDPKMIKIGSIKSNNSIKSSSNNSMSQKAMKVFGISEHEVPSMINVNNNINPLASNISLSPSQQFNAQMDNLNLSRYSINDGEKHFNGVISSKALKIIGFEDKNTPATNPTTNKKTSKKRDKVKAFEEVKESHRNLLPTVSALQPLIADYLYFNTHGVLRSWKKRFTILTQDNWLYSFMSNEPNTHAFIAIPINSNTTVSEVFDPISIVPYFIEIVTNWPIDSESRRFISIGCDNRQKCLFWINSIKRLIARDKFSNAKLPPNPVAGMDDDLDIGNVNINPSPVVNPVMMPGFRNGRPLTMSGPSMGGDLGSLYDDITGFKLERSSTYGEQPRMGTPMINPINGQANLVKRSPAKNPRVTKHPVRKESIKPRFSMINSPNLGAINVVSRRSSRINTNPSTIPMVSSSPILKGQYSPYSKPLNGFALTSPSIQPISLPSASQPIMATPKSYGGGASSYKRSPLVGPEVISSPILSPRQNPVGMMGTPYLTGYNPNHYNALNLMQPMEEMMDYESIQQQKMMQQEELIKQQQQQILLLQKQLLKSQQEKEQGLLDMAKDKNY